MLAGGLGLGQEWSRRIYSFKKREVVQIAIS
jgi:hypothetical protein